MKQKKVAILLPSILDVLEIPFNSQLTFLKKMGITPILINYSRINFDFDALESQILKVLDSNKNERMYFIGLSFGAMIIIDLLKNPKINDKVDKIILLGAAYSPDDIETSRRLLLSVLSMVDKISEKPANKIFNLIKKKSLFAYDPKEYKYINKTRVNKVFDQDFGLIERIRYFASHGAILNVKKINKQTLFIWWSKDAVSQEKQKMIMSRFPKHQSIIVYGLHGWTTSPANEINEAISDFLK